MGQPRGNKKLQTAFLQELDILLTPEQMETLYAGNGKKRAAARSPRRLWPKAIIPYTFMANTFSVEEKNLILAAMR